MRVFVSDPSLDAQAWRGGGGRRVDSSGRKFSQAEAPQASKVLGHRISTRGAQSASARQLGKLSRARTSVAAVVVCYLESIKRVPLL